MTKPVAPADDARPHTESASAPAAAKGVADVSVDVIASSPPPEAMADVGRAADVVDELHANNRELHFAKDKETGRIIVEVRDLDGNVLRTIPPGEAMDILAGGPFE